MWRIYAVLFGLGLGVAVIASLWVDVPGYMDAEYYFSSGQRLATGHGMTEMIIWNYLGEPGFLPAPSHTYWMPLASLLAAAGIKLSGLAGFSGARLPFLLSAALVPLLTAGLAHALTRQPRHAWLAGLLALFPGFYLAYWVTTDIFALVMLLGGGILLLVFPAEEEQRQPSYARFGILGVLAGLIHLARADGLLWLALVLLLGALAAWKRRGQRRWLMTGLALVGLALLGYALVTGFWYARNLRVFGALMPPGGSRTLWLTEYDQTFVFPGDTVSPAILMAGGWTGFITTRLSALAQNLETLLAVQGSVFLLPLAMVGLWRLRADPRVRAGVLIWLLVLGVMSLVFPFAGARGGFLHSSAALQPLVWAAVPVGLEAFIDLGVRKRGWQTVRAHRGFGVLLVGLTAVFTLAMYANLVIGADPTNLAWNRTWREAQTAERGLAERGAGRFHMVMVNNPPGYYAATGRAAIVIPHGGEDTLLAVARLYGASYVILEKNHVSGLDELYDHPSDRPGLIYLGSQGETHYFSLIQQSKCDFCP